MSTPGQWYRDRNPVNSSAAPKREISEKTRQEMLYSARMSQCKEWERRGFVVDHPLIHAFVLKKDFDVIVHKENLCDDNHWMDFAMILMALAG